MKVKVKFFAMLREIVARDEIEIELDESADVIYLRDAVRKRYPKLDKWLAIARVAVNEEFVKDNYRLKEDDEVSFIPPVSGG